MRSRSLTAALLFLAAACGAPDDVGYDDGAAPEQPPAAPAHEHGHGGEAPLADEPSDLSIYNLESTWRDGTGREISLGALAGRPQLVVMAYTSCRFACPRLLLDMKRIEGELGADEDLGFVLVTLDPERDTPERLAEYARGARLDPARWTLLTASEDAILELAAVLGVQYRETEPGEFVHSNLLTLLDAGGEIVHRQEGLGADPTGTLEALRALPAVTR